MHLTDSCEAPHCTRLSQQVIRIQMEDFLGNNDTFTGQHGYVTNRHGDSIYNISMGRGGKHMYPVKIVLHPPKLDY